MKILSSLLSALASTLAMASVCLGQSQCVGDCDWNGAVEIHELIQAVQITLGKAEIDTCSSCDANHDGSVGVNELVIAVNSSLVGCVIATALPTEPLLTPTETPTEFTPTGTPTEFTPTETPTATATRGGFQICGSVAERPRGTGVARGEVVQLDPLGVTATTDLSSGNFCFENLTAGRYSLFVVSGCNPFGCWKPVELDLVDEDRRVRIAISEFTPTPTITPGGDLATVCVKVQARPFSHEYVSGATVVLTLEEVSLDVGTIETGGDPPMACFQDIEPGRYLVTTEGCNEFGCWLVDRINVGLNDVNVILLNSGSPL